MNLGVLVRALLSALSVVVLGATSVLVAGGYFPRTPPLGAFGAMLNGGAPWIVAAAAAGAGLAGIAVALGGRKTIVLFAAGLVVLVGTVNVAWRYVSTASANGASYDLIRASDGNVPLPKADGVVTFANVDGQELRAGVWLPSDAESAGTETLPAVVFVHGGAFIAGGPGTRPYLLRELADRGIVAIDVEYRLSPPPRWDQAPADVLCALAWLPNASGFEMVDPDRVVVAGESAGGSLALLAAYAAGTDQMASSCPGAGVPLVPRGVLAIAPAADLEGIWTDDTIHDYQGARFPEAYIGGPPSEFPERYDAAEPFRLLRADLPPTLILAGESDRFVHLERIRSLVDAIRGAGSEVELVVAPFADHGFDGEPNSFGAQLSESLVPAFVLRVTATSS